MGYYVNQNIPYVAVGNCQDPYNGPYTYTWTFEDSTQQTGGSVTKAWATAGAHSASVSCLNTATGDTASAQNIITVLGYSESFTAASARYGAAVVELNDGRLFVISGYNTTSCYFVDPNTLASTLTTPIPTGYMNGHDAVVLSDGKVLVGGGENNTNFYVFNTSNETWTQVASPVGFPATFTESGITKTLRMSLINILGGKVLGIPFAYSLTHSSSRDQASYWLQIYDPATNTWDNGRSIGELGEPCYPRNVCNLGNGKLFIYRPKHEDVSDGYNLSHAYTFDLATNDLSSVINTVITKAGSSCLVPVAGGALTYGSEISFPNASVYKYDIALNTVSDTGYSFGSPGESKQVGVRDSGGGLFACGGDQTGVPTTNTRAATSAGSVTSLPPLAIARRYHNVVKHSNGKAYVMFGQKTDLNPTDTCYVYLV
jgi:hypothetical protein